MLQSINPHPIVWYQTASRSNNPISNK